MDRPVEITRSYAVIANPHEEIVKMVELSASRWRKKKGDE